MPGILSGTRVPPLFAFGPLGYMPGYSQSITPVGFGHARVYTRILSEYILRGTWASPLLVFGHTRVYTPALP